MQKTTKTRQQITITDTTDLGLGMLVLETGNGSYQPIAVVATINEAREIVRDDMARRMRNLAVGAEPLCPEAYKVWCRNMDGDYRVVATLEC
jgi:hypothetical protein